MTEDYLSNLPVEILHHVFQYCDAVTILCKIGSVCKRLRAIAYQYNGIKLEITGTNYKTLKSIFHRIPSHAVTSIEMTYRIDNANKADLEYYVSEITRFTQIRHLLLRTEYNYDLKWFLEQLNGIQPISLTINTTQQEPNEFTYSLIPFIITKFNLEKLYWINLSYKLENMSWPSDCKLTYLAMYSCLYSEYTKVLEQLPCLKTLRLNKMIIDNEKMSDILCTSRLTCLIIDDYSLSIEHLKLLACKTPALRNLTLAFHKKKFQSIADIYEWETFVRTQLNFLDKFEFFISYEYSFDRMINLELFLVPFQELFWLNEKHWNVACEYIFEGKKTILVYTPSNADRFHRDSYSKTNGILLKQNNYYITKRRENQQIDIAPCNTLVALDFGWSYVNLLAMEYLIHALKNNQTLVKLDLNTNKIGNMGIKLVVNAFKNSKTLAVLNLSNTDIDEEGARYVSIFLENNTTLNELNIGRNKIKDTGIQYLVQTVQNNHTLTKLTIDRSYIGEKGVHLIAHLLENNTRLTMVNLAGNKLGDNGMQLVCEALQKNRTLKEINVDRNEIGDTGAKCLAQLLQNNNVIIEKISIAYNLIQDDGAQYLALALRNNRTITTLDLIENKIDTRGAEYLVNELQSNTILTKLSSIGNEPGLANAVGHYISMKNSPLVTVIKLCGMRIRNDGVILIADALRKNITVKKLDVHECGIGTYGIKYLADALRENNTLEFLDLANNPTGVSGVNYLISALSEKQTQTLIVLLLGDSYVSQECRIKFYNMAYIVYKSKLPSHPDLEGTLNGYLKALNAAHMIRFDTTLTELKLARNICFGPAGAQQIAGALHNNTTLKTLTINADQIKRTGVQYLMNALKNNTTLEFLHFGEKSVWSSLCIDLVYRIQTDQTLTTLEIKDRNIVEEGFIYLCHAISYHPTITSLTLINNDIKSSMAIYLANMIRRNSTLTRLCSHKNTLGDHGIKELASALVDNITLKTLILGRNRISANGLKDLFDTLKHNTTLTVLNMKGDRIESED